MTIAASEKGDFEGGVLAGSGEAEVIACLEAGEFRQALALCARYHAVYIGRLCMAMLADQAEAEDIVQETLLTAYAGFASWRREGSVRAWLLGIARNKALKLAERQQRRGAKLRLIEGGEPSTRGPAAGAEEWLALKQKAELARSALEQIRPTEREALLLRYVAELDFEAVAALCGISEVTARKRISRGIAHLREVLRASEER